MPGRRGDDALAVELRASWPRRTLFSSASRSLLRLEPLDLTGAVERHAGERGDRLEEAAVLERVTALAAAALLLVEQREVTEEDAAIAERRGDELAIRHPREDAVAAQKRLSFGEELAPERLRRAARRRSGAGRASRRRRARGCRPSPRASPPPRPPDRGPGRRARGARRAAPAPGALGVELERQVVQRLELQQPPPVGEGAAHSQPSRRLYASSSRPVSVSCSGASGSERPRRG